MSITTVPTNNPNRGEVWLVRFDPTVGAEIKKVRPAVVLSIPEVGELPLRIVVPVRHWEGRFSQHVWKVRLPNSKANGLNKDSCADGFQVKSVSVNRFVEKIGLLTN